MALYITPAPVLIAPLPKCDVLLYCVLVRALPARQLNLEPGARRFTTGSAELQVRIHAVHTGVPVQYRATSQFWAAGGGTVVRISREERGHFSLLLLCCCFAVCGTPGFGRRRRLFSTTVVPTGGYFTCMLNKGRRAIEHITIYSKYNCIV